VCDLHSGGIEQFVLLKTCVVWGWVARCTIGVGVAGIGRRAL
jgi:hypothetical protein